MKCQFHVGEEGYTTFNVVVKRSIIDSNDVVVTINGKMILYAEGTEGVLRLKLANIHDLGLRIETV